MKKPSHLLILATRLCLETSWISPAKTRGFPPHPHGWFGFVDEPILAGWENMLKGKLNQAISNCILEFPLIPKNPRFLSHIDNSGSPPL
jgi:hypothetical protein